MNNDDLKCNFMKLLVLKHLCVKTFFLVFFLGTPDPNAEMATLVVLHVDEIELPWPKKNSYI